MSKPREWEDNDELDEFVELIPKEKYKDSARAWIEAFGIFAKHWKNGLDEKFFMGGEHDEIFIYVDLESIPPESEDGRRLIALGFLPDLDSENWMHFT